MHMAHICTDQETTTRSSNACNVPLCKTLHLGYEALFNISLAITTMQWLDRKCTSEPQLAIKPREVGERGCRGKHTSVHVFAEDPARSLPLPCLPVALASTLAAASNSPIALPLAPSQAWPFPQRSLLGAAIAALLLSGASCIVTAWCSQQSGRPAMEALRGPNTASEPPCEAVSETSHALQAPAWNAWHAARS